MAGFGVDRGVSEAGLQGAQIHWKLHGGTLVSCRGSHRGGGGGGDQAGRFGGVTEKGMKSGDPYTNL